MTDINNVASLAQPGDPQDLFAFKLHYTTVDDDINGTVTPLYNGNIAEAFWRTSSDNIKRKYGYSYDYGNRLLDAYYQLPGTAVPRADSYSTHYSYDRNGNILTLQRSGEQDLANAVIDIDDLVYSYDDGNQLKRVRDYENFSAGYSDAHTAANEDDFEYDGYGNLILDRDKGIASVEYNHLNLPTKVTLLNGNKIEYFYDATGIKLKKKVTDGSAITTTEYMDGFQYTNGELDFFPTAEGYVKALSSFGSSAYKYVFNYVDHLGNIRLSYAQDPQNSNQLAILEENHYYPYGLKHKGYNGNHQVWEIGTGGVVTLTPVNPFLGDSYKYKFGGKEYQTEFDINTYDFGARNYDPALGRWMNIDPLAEQMRRHSPYNYAFNNPVYFIDPDGMLPAGGFANIDPATSTGSMEISDFGAGNETGKSKANAGKYKAYFHQASKDLANTDLSVGGGGPGDPPTYNGPSVATGDAVNQLPEVHISGKGSSGDRHPGATRASWFVGTVAEGVRSNSSFYAENYTAKYGTKLLSNTEITSITRASMANTALGAKWVGAGASYAGIFLSGINFAMSKRSWGDYGRLGVSVTASLLTLDVVTAPVGIGIGLIDMGGGFNGFYNYLDGQEKLYNASGGVLLPGPTGLPVFTPLKN